MSSAPGPSVVRRSEEELLHHLRDGGPALVALSGGVDSSLVAALAHEALGPGVVAVTLSGPAVSAAELDRARAVAGVLGLRHEVAPADPMANARYRENPANRCYFCRSVETAALRSFGDARGVLQYLDGIQMDDLADDRPGIRAMDEAGFRHPLVWAGWTKADVRESARRRGLPNWDWPSDACLASRVAHGEALTGALLARVEAAEAVLLGRGFRRVRVRTRAGSARIEVDPGEVARLRAEPMASEVVAAVRALGFAPVSIDPEGYGRGARSVRTVP